MLFTRESDYALRLLRNLNTTEPTGVSSIVDKEHLTVSIAYKVARKLEKGGLLNSIRGQSGGYLLSRSLSDITLYDVYNITDPNAFVTECIKPDHICPLNSGNNSCSMHYELIRIQDVLNEELQRKNLQEIFSKMQ